MNKESLSISYARKFFKWYKFFIRRCTITNMPKRKSHQLKRKIKKLQTTVNRQQRCIQLLMDQAQKTQDDIEHIWKQFEVVGDVMKAEAVFPGSHY